MILYTNLSGLEYRIFILISLSTNFVQDRDWAVILQTWKGNITQPTYLLLAGSFLSIVAVYCGLCKESSPLDPTDTAWRLSPPCWCVLLGPYLGFLLFLLELVANISKFHHLTWKSKFLAYFGSSEHRGTLGLNSHSGLACSGAAPSGSVRMLHLGPHLPTLFPAFFWQCSPLPCN